MPKCAIWPTTPNAIEGPMHHNVKMSHICSSITCCSSRNSSINTSSSCYIFSFSSLPSVVKLRQCPARCQATCVLQLTALEGFSVQSEARHNVDGRGLRTVPFCYSLGWGLAGSSRKRASDGAILLQFQVMGEIGRFLRKLVPVLRVR